MKLLKENKGFIILTGLAVLLPMAAGILLLPYDASHLPRRFFNVRHRYIQLCVVLGYQCSAFGQNIYGNYPDYRGKLPS